MYLSRSHMALMSPVTTYVSSCPEGGTAALAVVYATVVSSVLGSVFANRQA